MATNIKKEDRGHVTRYDVGDVVEKLKAIHGQRFIDYRKAWDETCKCGRASEYPFIYRDRGKF